MDVGTLWNDLDDLRPLLRGERWQLTDEQELTAHDLTRHAIRKLQYVATELLADLDFRGVPLAHGFQTSERWYTVTQRVDLATAKREVRIARAIESKETPTVTEAWRDGHLDPDRVDVIVRTLEKLNDADVCSDDIATAEELLASHAFTLAPADLDKTAKAVIAALGPTIDEHHDDPATRTLTIAATGIGGKTFSIVNGTLDQIGHETVRAGLNAFTPERWEFPDLCEAQLRGQASVAMADAALRTVAENGARGGPARAVTVTIPLTVLTGDEPGTGQTGWSGPISAAAAQQIACDAKITRLILGTNSEPLDVGMSERYVTAPMREALHARDGGCVWPGCHRPPSHTEAHHLIPWEQDGPTAVSNLALFCAFHHHRFHAGQGWKTGLDDDGIPWVQTPRHLDPGEPKRYHERFVISRLGRSA